MALLNTFNMLKRLSSLSGSINTGESAGAGVLLSGGWKYGFARAVITTHYKQCHLYKVMHILHGAIPCLLAMHCILNSRCEHPLS